MKQQTLIDEITRCGNKIMLEAGSFALFQVQSKASGLTDDQYLELLKAMVGVSL